MHARHVDRGRAKVEINMTPMIDVVFQLLTFFLMTFRVTAVEGDIDLLLPRLDRPIGPTRSPVEVVRLRLRSTADGDLQSIELDGLALDSGAAAVEQLERYLVRLALAARAAGVEEPTLEVSADDHLHYDPLLAVVAAVAGRRSDAANPEPRIRRIKFTAQ